MTEGAVAQIGGAIPTAPLDMVLQASLVTKIVLALLAVLSLISWAIMFAKWIELGRVERAGRAFTRASVSAGKFEVFIFSLSGHRFDATNTDPFIGCPTSPRLMIARTRSGTIRS